MKRDNKIIPVPHTKNSMLEFKDHQTLVSLEVMDAYGDTGNCGEDINYLRPALKIEYCACSANLCNFVANVIIQPSK